MTNGETPEPRVAIVAGGSRGIGRSVVQRLAGDGYSIVIAYASNHGEASAAVADKPLRKSRRSKGVIAEALWTGDPPGVKARPALRPYGFGTAARCATLTFERPSGSPGQAARGELSGVTGTLGWAQSA